MRVEYDTMQVTSVEIKECEEVRCTQNADIRVEIGGHRIYFCLNCFRNARDILNDYED